MRSSLCLALLFAALASALVSEVRAANEDKQPSVLRVYLGTYTHGKSQGIYLSECDLATGKLSEPQVAVESKNPSFLAIAPNGKFLAACNEISDLNGKPVGGISSYSIDPNSGKLTLLSQQSSGGAGPCHVSFDKKGQYVFGANYGGGSCCAVPMDSEGKLSPMTGFVQHEGKRIHAHSIYPSADNRFVFCADLGLDKILIYKLTAEGKLVPNDPAFGATPAGGGPRHFAFHPNNKFAYTCLETASGVTAFSYNADKGELKEIQTLSTLPEPVKGNSTAEIQVHPSGKFVYVSNRGHNSIAVFKVGEDGKLTAAGHQGKGVKIPRNFGVDPTGKYVLVCNQDADSVLVFKVNQDSGMLEPTENKIVVPMPVCVKFMALR